jgi:hypothetical protein
MTNFSCQERLNILDHNRARRQLNRRIDDHLDEKISGVSAPCVGVAPEPPTTLSGTQPLTGRACRQEGWCLRFRVLAVRSHDAWKRLAKVAADSFGTWMVY